VEQSVSWNDSVFAELGEKAFEHLSRIDAVVETSPARLDGARDVVKFSRAFKRLLGVSLREIRAITDRPR
jgi:hypothetical protein